MANITLDHVAKFLKEDAHLFTCLTFFAADGDDALGVRVISDPGRCLKSDIDLLTLMIQSGRVDYIAEVRLKYTDESSYSQKSLVQLARALGKMPAITGLHVETVASNKSSKMKPSFPVEALTAFFKKNRQLEYFTMAGIVQGDHDGFEQWATALSRTRNSLESFDCWKDGGSWSPSSNRVHSMQISKWDPVIRTVVLQNSDTLQELFISTGEKSSKGLTEETSAVLARSMREPMQLIEFRPTFSNMNDLVLYCSNQTTGIPHFRFNFFESLVAATKTGVPFLHGILKDRTNVTYKAFSLSFQCRSDTLSRNVDHACHDIDVSLTNGFEGVDNIPAALRMELLDRHDGKVSEGRLEFPETSLLDRSFQPLWTFDPMTATPEQWCRIMAALGCLCQDERLLDEEVDLNPLYYLVSEYHDKLPGIGTQKPAPQSNGRATTDAGEKEAAEKLTAAYHTLKAENAFLQAENASLTAHSAELAEGAATLLQKVASLEDEVLSLRLLLEAKQMNDG
ncbi:expressed unknown protein [Seminavis robusta]|uniref:Uncharacterized protein n=1 Tax=Seminavis robusta TaxID=568900 RepID=A0A9N8H8K0_9STRA|nr:expressed unknown protein [Seminavis robusta]|eukprot:Sro243_g096890.1 n/a (510) ;mRNA; f:41354-42883